MGKLVFNYRSGGIAVVASFVFLWALIFGYGAWTTPLTNYTINDRPATISEAQLLQAITMGIAILVGLVAIWSVLWMVNTRIEIEGEEIRCMNWLGRTTLHSTSNRVMLIPDDSRPSGTKYMTEVGEIKFRKTIGNYGALLSILNNARSGFQHWDQRVRKHATYRPSPMVFNYRWTSLHLFSFIWLGIILFMMMMETGLFGTQPKGMPPAAVYTILSLFAVPGVWMQMTGWVERVMIGPDTIQWIDWTGRTRVLSPIDDVEGSDISTGYGGNGQRSESYKVFTDHGTIQTSNYISGYSVLQREIDRVVQSRI